MNPKNEEYLFNNFTHLYKNLYCPVSVSNMAFGLEVGDGWFELIKELSAKLNPIGCVASQVKEKYGTLRFYIHSATDEAFDLVDKAEAKSETTCEWCGKPGKLRGKGWITVRCERCYNDDQKG
ncbi:hypothetical protein LCGC14_0344700 [marine sediment metagenome]|uniref:Uncharacterized protein n=1 Tax=marine sediment metagenome TaxID=412755 RepID=A0A0F9TID0_9ZZZZ